MKKKLLSVMLCVAMTATIFAGCGNEVKEDTADAGTTATAESTGSTESADAAASTDASDISGSITFVSGNDQTGAVDKMIALFNEKYPNVTVDHQQLPGNSDDVKKSLMTSLAAGDTQPDVFECDSIWVSQFAAAGWLMDVTSDLEANADSYLGGPLSTCYYDGVGYAFPNYTDVGLLYYRTDIIDTPPTTWDELVEMCNEHVGEGGTEYGYVFQMFQGEPTSCNMLEFIKQNGGQDLVDGQFDMDNENTIEALEFVESLIADGITPEGVLSHKPDDTRAIFEEGKAIFMRNWTYAYANANMDTSKVAGNVGVAALPIGPNGTESSGTLGGWDYAINVNTEYPEAAKAFAQFMSEYEAQKIQTVERGTFPACAAVYDDEEVTTEMPHLLGVKDAADAAKPRPQVRDYSTISTIFQNYFHAALTGQSTNEDAVKAMNEELNAALAEMQ